MNCSPQNAQRKPGREAHAHKLSDGEAETGRALEFAG